MAYPREFTPIDRLSKGKYDGRRSTSFFAYVFYLRLYNFRDCGGMIYFLRSRRNRDIAQNALAGDGFGRGAAADGALQTVSG